MLKSTSFIFVINLIFNVNFRVYFIGFNDSIDFSYSWWSCCMCYWAFRTGSWSKCTTLCNYIVRIAINSFGFLLYALFFLRKLIFVILDGYNSTLLCCASRLCWCCKDSHSIWSICRCGISRKSHILFFVFQNLDNLFISFF